MFLSKKPSAKPIHARNGFLLFELTTALAIIAFLCALGIPCLRCLDKAHIRGEVEKLSSQIQYSQGLAIATGKTQEVPLVSHDPTVKITRNTFPQKKILCSPSGVVCAGTVYLTDVQQQFCYALSIPVGGCYRYLSEQSTQLPS